MINIENELTKQFLADKIQEIKGYGNRKTILETADNIINKDADLIKQALIERMILLKKEILEQWEQETMNQKQQIESQQKALKEYEEDIKQIEGLKKFKRISLK